jgi:hypothetical protein
MWILEQFSSALNKAKHGLAPALYALERNMGLPLIRGTWFFVDPKSGNNSNGGRSIADAVADLKAAYDLCTTNVGDGIAVLSADGTTYTNTTSFLKAPIVWSKNSITVIGVCAPTRIAQRARVESVIHTITASTIAIPTTTTITDSASGFLTAGFSVGDYIRINDTGNFNDTTGHIITAVTAGTITCAASTLVVKDATACGATTINSYLSELISVTGSNNVFSNLHLTHTATDALGLSALKVSGSRNYFENIHAGVGVADANTTITHSLWLAAAAAENTFVGCTFGLDTVDRGGVATYDIYLSGAVARNEFHGCRTTRHSSTGTGCLAVYADTTTGGRPTLFVNCIFSIWNTAGGNANCSYMFGSTGACDFVWFVDCTYPGYAALSNDSVAWISGEVNTQASGLMYT